MTRERLAQSAPRALDDDQQRDLVRAAEHVSPRDRAIVVLLRHTGLRLSSSSRWTSVMSARRRARASWSCSGKGDAHREVPLNATARAVVDAWRKERAKVVAEGERRCWSDAAAGG